MHRLNALHKQWQTHWREHPRMARHLDFKDTGLVLGTVTLAKFDAAGILAPENDRITLLLAAAYGDHDKARCLNYIHAAAIEEFFGEAESSSTQGASAAPIPGPKVPFPSEDAVSATNAASSAVEQDAEITRIIDKANQTIGNDGDITSSKDAALEAGDSFVGENARTIYKGGQAIGKISADGTKVIRYNSINKPDSYINLENKATGGNLHVRWPK